MTEKERMLVAAQEARRAYLEKFDAAVARRRWFETVSFESVDHLARLTWRVLHLMDMVSSERRAARELKQVARIRELEERVESLERFREDI